MAEDMVEIIPKGLSRKLPIPFMYPFRTTRLRGCSSGEPTIGQLPVARPLHRHLVGVGRQYNTKYPDPFIGVVGQPRFR